MKDILQERFVQLLLECSQRKVSVTEFTEAIEELATHLADFSFNDRIIVFYFVISPLVCIDLNRIVCGLSKKKMPYLHLIDEAIELIKTEVRIVNLHIKYPEQFQQHANKLFLSPLQLADKTSLINIIEIVSGLFLSKRIN